MVAFKYTTKTNEYADSGQPLEINHNPPARSPRPAHHRPAPSIPRGSVLDCGSPPPLFGPSPPHVQRPRSKVQHPNSHWPTFIWCASRLFPPSSSIVIPARHAGFTARQQVTIHVAKTGWALPHVAALFRRGASSRARLCSGGWALPHGRGSVPAVGFLTGAALFESQNRAATVRERPRDQIGGSYRLR